MPRDRPHLAHNPKRGGSDASPHGAFVATGAGENSRVAHGHTNGDSALAQRLGGFWRQSSRNLQV